MDSQKLICVVAMLPGKSEKRVKSDSSERRDSGENEV